jgi:hypothetical protein
MSRFNKNQKSSSNKLNSKYQQENNSCSDTTKTIRNAIVMSYFSAFVKILLLLVDIHIFSLFFDNVDERLL